MWLIGHIQSEVKRIYGNTIPLDRQHIVGHYEVNPKTKPYCPGELFPWDGLMARLAGEPQPANEVYRVQTGYFESRENAENWLSFVRAKGIESFITVGSK